MKRKRTPASTSNVPVTPALVPPASEIVPKQIMENAVAAIELDRRPTRARCTVCNEECAPNSAEGLCWVCRRLKLSAWRDSDTQMPAQE